MAYLGPVPWTTEGEINFIRGLGTHRLSESERKIMGDLSPEVRLALLQKYEQGIAVRTQWGAIDPGVVKKELGTLIALLQSQLRG